MPACLLPIYIYVYVCVCALLFRCVDDVNAEMRHIGVGPSMLSEVYRRYKENRVSLSAQLSRDKKYEALYVADARGHQIRIVNGL